MKEYRQHSYQPPAGATEILLVRHGESRPASPENPFPLVEGHGDPELHENGRQQANLVGEPPWLNTWVCNPSWKKTYARSV